MNENNSTQIRNWLEKAYIEYQIKNGRTSLRKIAFFIGISAGYLSQLMSGYQQSIGLGTAYAICRFYGNWGLFDYLPYEKPIEGILIPPIILDKFNKATREIDDKLRKVYHTDEEAMNIYQ